MIFQVHETHGRHIAYTPQEAESNRKRGWKDVSREVFYAKEAHIAAVEGGNVEDVVRRKPGRPRKVNGN